MSFFLYAGMTDALATLARLRRLEAEQAKRDLAQAIAQARAAQRALGRTEAQVAQEARVPSGDAPGAFAAWLPVAMEAVKQGRANLAQADRAGAEARAALAARQAALKAAETVLEAQAALARRSRARRDEAHREDDCRGRADAQHPHDPV